MTCRLCAGLEIYTLFKKDMDLNGVTHSVMLVVVHLSSAQLQDY